MNIQLKTQKIKKKISLTQVFPRAAKETKKMIALASNSGPSLSFCHRKFLETFWGAINFRYKCQQLVLLQLVKDLQMCDFPSFHTRDI